ncbi:MAG: methionine--tRNA ligase [Myxococcota bacterium]
MAGDTFTITTPIYYLNGSPHIGHAYTTIAADTAARWHRLRGRSVWFLTGTDEHGQKVLEAAQRLGRDPKAHCDLVSAEFRAMMDKVGVRFDRFIRTTDRDHEALVQASLQALFDRGEIYKDQYRGWYYLRDEVFVTDKEREDKLASGEFTASDFRMVEETNWFFRMGSYQQRLLDHLAAHPDTIRPDSRRNEVLGFLQRPLEDLCISRPKARMSWGIELPFDRDYVCYVWFDALLNYLTGTGWTADGASGRWPADYQLLGKDILTTHAVYWTTMLMALGAPLPRHLFAHGWWVSASGQKMSKSLGNVIDVGLLVDGFGVDATRFFLLKEIRFGADGQFSYAGFLEHYNADLANDLGNLVHRALTMSGRWLGGVVPDRGAVPPDPGLVARAKALIAGFGPAFDALAFKDALELVADLVRAGNKYVDTSAPWALNKAGNTAALAAAMRDTLELCAMAAAHLLPVMPGKAGELLGRLGATEADAARWLDGWDRGERVLDALVPGAPLTTGDPLFPRLAELPPAIAALFEPEPGPASGTEESAMAEGAEVPLPDLAWIEYDDFAKVVLKVGKVLEAAPHPNADKLVVMKVDVGEARPRTICAGIRAKFAPEQLVGRNVVVVANLKPRPLRGITSEGMILAASETELVDLVSANAAPGASIK